MSFFYMLIQYHDEPIWECTPKYTHENSERNVQNIISKILHWECAITLTDNRTIIQVSTHKDRIHAMQILVLNAKAKVFWAQHN